MNIQKFTEEELNSIKSLQQKYQEKLISFGQLGIDRMSIEQAIKELNESENKLRLEYFTLQEEEKKLLETLSSKYGNGSLSLNVAASLELLGAKKAPNVNH